MNTIEKRIALLRERTPILASLLLCLHDRPEFAQLDDWVYSCSGLYNNGSYATLGALLSEMLPAYEGLRIGTKSDNYDGKSFFFDGHNAFEEFVISVWDAIAKYNKAFNGEVYDIDALTSAFLQSILPEYPDYAEPPTDDTGGGRY